MNDDRLDEDEMALLRRVNPALADAIERCRAERVVTHREFQRRRRASEREFLLLLRTILKDPDKARSLKEKLALLKAEASA